MKILDLFCCDGGAAIGMKRACPNAEITGIDIDPHPNYPFQFIQKDILDLDSEWIKSFDFIWASPPCQKHAAITTCLKKKGKIYPDLIGITRKILLESNKPFVIENVVEAQKEMQRDLTLCGLMFGLPIYRHRIFEIHGFNCTQPTHIKHDYSGKNIMYTIISGKKDFTSLHATDPSGRARRNQLTIIPKKEKMQEVMQMPHCESEKYLAEAVHPCYSEYILKQWLNPTQKKLII
jgi:DNA (cytosine-5)-methyltransferase 1